MHQTNETRDLLKLINLVVRAHEKMRFGLVRVVDSHSTTSARSHSLHQMSGISGLLLVGCILVELELPRPAMASTREQNGGKGRRVKKIGERERGQGVKCNLCKKWREISR